MNHEVLDVELSIDKFQDGVFWCRHGALGIDAEEIESYKAGKLPDQRRQEISCRIQMAMNSLRAAEVPGAQFWMTHKRMVS